MSNPPITHKNNPPDLPRRLWMNTKIKWKGYPERHKWTWEPLRNLTHADQAVDDFHKSHPASPRRTDMNNFTFVPIPENDTIQSTAEQWINGKINPDGWTLRINTIPNFQESTPTPEPEVVPIPSPQFHPIENEIPEITWSAIPIKDWNIPDDNAPPSPPRPPPRRLNPIKREHANMHWSFCKIHNCRFHRGENSWSY
ncbi:hypothetical protein PILCRDRAFT_14184 [Piloderma croceum F 1598]|uniref:Chromo domain-containing protein n=1 Tax=Piloderma croceum (strain F 1598) TaxID=765440 RepID=A0A0C3EQB7_PILCF|nr:hypothetical protein PILCRDRAFT_14184 [Piloderma croceum F 1598]